MIFGPLLALIFHQKSRHPENVCFETSIKRELRFSMPKPHILASIFDQISMYFLISFRNLIFLSFFQILCEIHRFWVPLRHPPGPKMAPKIAQVAPKDACTHPYAPPPGLSKNRKLRKTLSEASLAVILVDLGCIFQASGALCHPFGSIWLPGGSFVHTLGSLLLPFRYLIAALACFCAQRSLRKETILLATHL